MLKKLIKVVGLLLLLTTFSNCRVFKPQEWCSEHYPAQTSDSVTTVISYECDYDTIRLPYKELSFDTTGVIPNSVVFHHEAKKDGLSSLIDIRNGHLTFKCAEDSLKSVIEYQKKIISTSEKQVKVVTMACTREHKTKFNYFCSYWFWITFSLILIWLILKLLKMYLSGK